MIIYLAIIACGILVVIQSIQVIRRDVRIRWIGVLRMVVGLYWIGATVHVLFITDKILLTECYALNDSFLWPGILIALAVMAASSQIWNVRWESTNGNGKS